MKNIVKDIGLDTTPLAFCDLETRYGRSNAIAIVRTLEQFEGVMQERVVNLSFEDRLENVMRLMGENIRYQTRH